MGYDTLIRQMQAIQGQTDVYKRGSPLPVETHMHNIARSLSQDYGINSFADIGVTPRLSKFNSGWEIRNDGVMVWGKDNPYQGYHSNFAPGTPVQKNLIDPLYYNKNTGQQIPGYKFASEGGGHGYSDYNLQPVPDGKGGLVGIPIQDYNLSGFGSFVQDLGPAVFVANALLLAAGAPPVAVAAGNVALQAGAGNINNIGDVLQTAAPILVGDPGIVGGAAKVYAAYNAFDKGEVVSGLANLAGAAGFNGLSNDLRFVNAIRTGDVPGALVSLSNMSGLFDTPLKDDAGNILKNADGTVQTVGNIKIGGENNYITLRDAVKGSTISANLLSDSPNYGLALQMAGELVGSGDTILAGKATSLIEAINSGNPAAIGLATIRLADQVNSKAPRMAPVEHRSANQALRGENSNIRDVLPKPTGRSFIIGGNKYLPNDQGGATTVDKDGSVYELSPALFAALGPIPQLTGESVTIGGKKYEFGNDGYVHTVNPAGGYYALDPTQFAALGEPDSSYTNTNPFTGKSVTIDGKKYDLLNDGGAYVSNENGAGYALNASQFAALGEPDTTTKIANDNDLLASDLGTKTTTTTGGTTTTPLATGKSFYIDGKKYDLLNDGGAYVSNENGGGSTRLTPTELAALGEPPLLTGKSVTIDGKKYEFGNDGYVYTVNSGGGYNSFNASQFAALGEPDDNDLLASDLGTGTTTTTGGTKLDPTDTKATTTPTYTSPFSGKSVTIDGKKYEFGNDGYVYTENPGGGYRALDPTQFAALGEPDSTTTPTYNSPFSVKIGDKEYDLDNMGGASTKNADGTITKLNATQFAALGEPAITVSDLYNMDAYLGATGEYIYKDSSGSSYFVDDNGDVQSLTKQQADALVSPNTKEYTGKLDPVTIIGDKYKESLGYDWFPNLGTTTSSIPTLTSDQISAIPSLNTVTITGKADTITTDSIKALTTDSTKALTTDSTKALTTDNTGTIGGGTIGGGTIGGGSTGGGSTGGGSTTNTGTLTSDQISALTTTEPRGLQALPTSDARYWRQTGATGTGGKGGVKFFDWYDTPENRTMAPPAMTTATFGALTSQQAGTIAAPTAKRYFNQATNRYYTDPTGTWQPPAGWAQTGLKGGGEVKTKHFDAGGWAIGFGGDSIDAPSYGYDWGYDGGGMPDSDIYSYLRSLPADNSWDSSSSDYGFNFDLGDLTYGFDEAEAERAAAAADAENVNNIRWDRGDFGDPEDPRNPNYGNEGRAYSGRNAIDPVTGSPINAKVGVPNKRLSSASNPLKNLADAAKRNPDLMKMLLGAGLGGLLGYMGRPKGIKPKGMQGGSLGLSQGQVYGALKGKPVQRAEGGEIDGYARGGGLSYLKSAEDGMADKIPATIDNKQPAKLSGGEFVIPADVVSHLGNGNSEAGAKQLYDMMDRIRHARTGTKKQGKQVNPAKFTPK